MKDDFLETLKRKFIENVNKKEVERKFLIKEVPDYLWNYDYIESEQYYITINPQEIRVRKANESFFLTFKSDGNLERSEVEISITEMQFDELKEFSKHQGVLKTRYFIKEDGYTYELDIYKNIPELITLEVEFESTEDAHAFQPPEWFGDEITNIPEFKNKNLSCFGFPRTLKCAHCKGVGHDEDNETCKTCEGKRRVDISKVSFKDYHL